LDGIGVVFYYYYYYYYSRATRIITRGSSYTESTDGSAAVVAAAAVSDVDTKYIAFADVPIDIYLSAISDVPLVKAIYSIVVSHPRRETRADAVLD